MTSIDQRVEQEIKRYEAHLKKINDLFDKVEQHSDPKVQDKVEEMKLQRGKLEAQIQALKNGDVTAFEEMMMTQSGPMGIWDALALELEKLLEQIEK